MNIVIKDYEEKYINQVISLFKDGLGIEEEVVLRYIPDTLAKPGGKFWVAVENDDKVLGILQFTYEKWNMIGNIGVISTTADARGKGIGRALMNKAEEYAKEVGVRKIYVDTAADNQAAQIFYIKCGYFPEYSMKDYYEPGLHGINFSKYIK